MELTERRIYFEDIDPVSLFGYNDIYLNMIENRFKTTIVVRGNNVILRGYTEEILKIETIFKELRYMLDKNGMLTETDVSSILDLIEVNPSGAKIVTDQKSTIIYHGAKEVIKAKSPKQADYFHRVQKNDLVFAIGPAGTGKTFLAVAMALSALKRNEASKIILSRPAVEAGESLGYLPGDLYEKIDPYIKPLTDSLTFMLTPEKLKNLKDREIIEITPLAYMRGRTLNNAFIILDEAQNATTTQMKMFLTRMGAGSKAIVTGDITQIDLPDKKNSGLISASNILKGIDGIEFVYFDTKDVVRHKLVARIIEAYEKVESLKSTRKVTGKE